MQEVRRAGARGERDTDTATATAPATPSPTCARRTQGHGAKPWPRRWPCRLPPPPLPPPRRPRVPTASTARSSWASSGIPPRLTRKRTTSRTGACLKKARPQRLAPVGSAVCPASTASPPPLPPSPPPPPSSFFLCPPAVPLAIVHAGSKTPLDRPFSRPACDTHDATVCARRQRRGCTCARTRAKQDAYRRTRAPPSPALSPTDPVPRGLLTLGVPHA